MGRTGQRALVHGALVLGVLAVGCVVAASRDGVPIAKAATTVAVARNATVVEPGGARRPARVGERLPRGAVVMVGRSGVAQLVTQDRTTWLEGGAVLAVVDGAHQQLRTGTAVVDAQHSPGLALALAGDRVAVPGGSAVEATRSVSVRVGTLAGPAQLTSGSGRRLALPALAQTVVSGDALPGAWTPLHLTDSAVEARVVAPLVADDLAMATLARGIDTTGTATVAAIDASWTGTASAGLRRAARSERLLPIVVADATGPAGAAAQTRYDRVVAWRRSGGSWGVIVHLLSARASAVEAALAHIEHGQPQGRLGTGLQAQALGGPAGGHIGGGPGVHHPGSGGPHPGQSPPPSTPPTTSGPGPDPTPPPTQRAVNGVVGTVQGVVGKVLHLIPTPVHSTGKGSTKPAPTHSGLLGGLLGGH